jgi:DNA repair exonuclease SbcCD ATPase subunit
MSELRGGRGAGDAAALRSRLAAAQREAADLEARADAEAAERRRWEAAAGQLEREASGMRQAYSQLQGKASELAGRLEEARREVADANALLAASRGRIDRVQAAWSGTLAAGEVRGSCKGPAALLRLPPACQAMQSRHRGAGC